MRKKRALSSLLKSGQKINSTKILEMTDAGVSTRTVQRHLKRIGLVYKKAGSKIYLTKAHKERRIVCATKWLQEEHVWEKNYF